MKINFLIDVVLSYGAVKNVRDCTKTNVESISAFESIARERAQGEGGVYTLVYMNYTLEPKVRCTPNFLSEF